MFIFVDDAVLKIFKRDRIKIIDLKNINRKENTNSW